MVSRLSISILCAIAPCLASAASVYDIVGQRYNVDPNLLKAYAMVESHGKPWTLDINGEPAACTSRSRLVAGFDYVQTRPWMITVPTGYARSLYRLKGAANCVFRGVGYDRLWFHTRESAIRFCKIRHLGSCQVQHKDVSSTDVGLMQINWAAHRSSIPNVAVLADPIYNVAFGATFLIKLAKRYGPWQALAYYHNGSSPQIFRAYRLKILKEYRHLSDEPVTYASELTPNGG